MVMMMVEVVVMMIMTTAMMRKTMMMIVVMVRSPFFGDSRTLKSWLYPGCQMGGGASGSELRGHSQGHGPRGRGPWPAQQLGLGLPSLAAPLRGPWAW